MGLWKTFLVYFPARCIRGSNREAVRIRFIRLRKDILTLPLILTTVRVLHMLDHICMLVTPNWWSGIFTYKSLKAQKLCITLRQWRHGLVGGSLLPKFFWVVGEKHKFKGKIIILSTYNLLLKVGNFLSEFYWKFAFVRKLQTYFFRTRNTNALRNACNAVVIYFSPKKSLTSAHL